MHPIERLRHVARSAGGDPAELARDAAPALAALAGDPAGLVTACRRLLQPHPAAAPLWWLAARALCALDPRAEIWAAVDDLEQDTTPTALAVDVPQDARVVVVGFPVLTAAGLERRGDVEVLATAAGGDGGALVRYLLRCGCDATEVPDAGVAAAVTGADLVLLEAGAVGSDAFVAPIGSRAAAAVARDAEVPVWLVAGVGRVLPPAMFDVLQGILEQADEPWSEPDEVVPLRLVDTLVRPAGFASSVAPVADCAAAAELLRSLA